MRWLVAAVLMLSLGACDKEESKTTGPQPGAEGGKCYGNNTCNKPLSCAGGYCVPLKKDDVSTTSTANEGAANKAEGKQAWKNEVTKQPESSLLKSGGVVLRDRIGGMGFKDARRSAAKVEDLPLAGRLHKSGLVSFKAHEYQRAIEQWARAIEVAPSLEAVYPDLAYAYLKKGNLKGCIEVGRWCSERLSDASFLGACLYNAGICHKEHGDISKARSAWKQSLAVRENRAVRRKLAELGSAQVDPGQGSDGLGLKGADAADIGEPKSATICMRTYPPDATHVDCKGGSLYEDDLQSLKGLTKLRSIELKVSKGGFTGAGLKHLANLRNLEKLNIDGLESITDEGFLMVRHLKSLRKILFEHMGDARSFTGSGLAGLADLPKLESLRFEDSCRIGDDGLRHLQTISSKRFVKLAFTNCPITTDGLKHLKSLKTLQTLIITEANIKDSGLKHLTGLTNLRYAGFSRTRVTDAGCKMLRDAIPNLECTN
jgi:tetratricopeptide (TPR) repeat protein